MDISVRFNRFYHSVLNDLYRKSPRLVFRDLLDTRTNGAFTITRHEDYLDMDDLKQLMKILNVNYTTDEAKDKKASTKDIDNQELLNHIEYIFRLAANNGITLQIVQDEWDYLLNYYKD